MTDLEMRALAPSEHIIADLLEKRNKGTEDCVLTSDIAHEIGMNTLDFNSFLIDKKILERRNHRLRPTEKYANKGYTMFQILQSRRTEGDCLSRVDSGGSGIP